MGNKIVEATWGLINAIEDAIDRNARKEIEEAIDQLSKPFSEIQKASAHLFEGAKYGLENDQYILGVRQSAWKTQLFKEKIMERVIEVLENLL